jgi:hypothetical protein
VPCQDLRLERSDPPLEFADLASDHLQHPTSHVRYAFIRVIHHDCSKSYHSMQALCLDKTELGQMPAQSIDQHSALADQRVPGAVHH